MSDNKFIERLKGKDTSRSVLEINNEATKTSFANMPSGTSNAIDVYSDYRGNATAVLNGTTNWKVSNSDLLLVDAVSGDGQDFTSTYSVAGAGLWVNASYTFPSTGDPRHPVAMVFNPSTKWVLKVCGDNLIVDGGSTVDFTMLVKIGTSNVYSKNFTIRESAGQFSKEFIIDFGEANSDVVKVGGLSTLTVQLLCGTANASARIYNGMTVLTCLQRKVDASAVSNSSANVEDVLDGNIIPSDYFSNPEFIDQVEDGEDAYAVFTRDGDDVNFSGWTQPIPDQANNNGKFLTTDGSSMSWEQIEISNVDGLQTELTDLQDQIDDVSGRGRFLTLWNCATGLAESNPPESPYPYKAGDYFVVGTVSSADPAVNYKPDGSSYTTGVASTTVETNEVSVNDTYFYDGTVWKLQSNAQKEVSFSALAGSPYDNTNLSNALNAKANSADLATVATSGSYNDLLNKPTIPTVNDATLTIQKNGTDVATFTANSSTNTTANITVPTKVSDLTNDSGFISSASVSSLTDVTLTNLSDGDALVYDANSSKWVNGNGGVSASYDAGTKTITFA